MHAMTRPPIALIGIMGAGKSAVARELGYRLGVDAEDLDDMLEADVGCSIGEYFAREGEAAFRRREGELLRAAVDRGARVIACGGGIVIDAAQRLLLLKRCHAVWLEVTIPEAWRRVAASGRVRPLLHGTAPEDTLAMLLARRAALYSEVARIRIATDGRSPRDIAGDVIDSLAGNRA